MKSFKYSVLSSVYYKENPEYLKQSIDSMLNQTVVTNDYVIVKDGPLTPELDEVLNYYETQYDFFNVYSQETNKGLGSALNFGLQHCKNELVARMDTDDISLCERCEKQIKMFEENSDLQIVGTSMYEFIDDPNKLVDIKIMPVKEIDIRKYARRRNPFNHPTVMYKKSMVMKFGGYSEGARGEDYELFTKIVFSGVHCLNLGEPLLRYRAAKNQYNRRTSKIDAKAVIAIARKNYNNGYISIFDLIYIVFFHFIGLIIPKSLGKKIFRKFFRKNHI